MFKPITRAKRDYNMPMASSMRDMYLRTGMPIALSKALKEQGCRAFDASNRVDMEVLLKFFFANYDDGNERPPDNIPTWREALTRSQTKRSDLELAKETGIVITKDEITQTIQRFCGIFFGGLKRLRQEAPRDFEMRPKDYIAKGIDEKLDEIVDQAKGSVEHLLEERNKVLA